jgi:hypothetical protein
MVAVTSSGRLDAPAGVDGLRTAQRLANALSIEATPARPSDGAEDT